MEILNLVLKNLMTLKELQDFCALEFSTCKSTFIAQKIEKYIIRVNQKLYYFDDENKIYIPIEKLTEEKYLILLIKQLFENSLKSLSENDRRLFQIDNNKIYHLIKKDTFTKDYLNDIIMLLSRDIKFDISPSHEIHFKNGYYDLKLKKFSKRTHKHFITRYINRNYEDPKKETITYIKENVINLIFPKKDERDYIFANQFGSALSGKAINDQSNFFMLGKGSSGKSLIMKLIKLSISCYMIEFKSDTFSKGNPKQDKIFNSLLINNLVRFCWINELSDAKLDDSLFKSFCEGTLQTTSLFKDGSNDFSHTCKLISTMNEIPSIKIDSGTSRRIIAYNPLSKFTDNKNEIDEEKYIFKKDDTIVDKFENSDELLNGLFKIISNYSFKYINDKNHYKMPESLKNAKNDIVESNDTIGNFLDKYIKITTCKDDRISGELLFSTFKEDQKNKNSFITMKQFRSALADRNINYNRNLSFSTINVRGGFVGIKYTEEEEEEETETEKIEKFKDIIKNRDLEIEKLKKRIEELEKPEENPEKTFFTIDELKNKTKKTKKNIITENDYKDTEKNIFTIDELKKKTKTKKNIVNVLAENDYEDEDLSDLDLSI